jgi:hypothetical protein
VDYPLREPALMFLFFTLAGALTKAAESPEIDSKIQDTPRN